MKEIVATNGVRFRRVSRWLTVKHNYHPNKRNSLWDYVYDESGYHPHQAKFDPKSGLNLDYFTYNGRNYAVEQFYVFGSAFLSGPPIFYDTEDGKLGVIGTVDMDGNIFHPLYGEWDEYCERVRLYEEAR